MEETIRPLPYFSKREKQIIELSAEGLSDSEISEEMSIAVRTVENLRQNVLEKTNYENIIQLINECKKQSVI
ncbi:hypothetical protein DBR43_27120 [Pedobacter sp. KBW06]|uniref:helix-turn-helix transcriptional regulator n=1 Tax=Pedobacter sp. KBW06 TaxID=2153359 RepID=UPI000F5A5B38|nr:helix-turn-helix transcriptional regulator [Pedobacter sp. KBW06]RQO65922.1 hypothetical protein DBR43_27120 [Pedobacter sp. KBW06]